VITLRHTTIDDANTLFAWVNSPDSLEASLRTMAPIPWEQHVAWLTERLHDHGSLLLIAEQDAEPVGQVRFQDAGEGPEVSIFVAAAHRDKGLAQEMLRLAIPLAVERWPHTPLFARIKPANAASRSLFLSVGFRLLKEAADHLVFNFTPSCDYERRP